MTLEDKDGGKMGKRGKAESWPQAAAKITRRK